MNQLTARAEARSAFQLSLSLCNVTFSAAVVCDKMRSLIYFRFAPIINVFVLDMQLHFHSVSRRLAFLF